VNDIEEEKGMILLIFSGNLQGFLYLKMSENIKKRCEEIMDDRRCKSHKTLGPIT